MILNISVPMVNMTVLVVSGGTDPLSLTVGIGLG